MNVSPDVKRAMTSFKTAMNKKYGEDGDIFSSTKYQNFESISSGSAILDGLLGNGGWVKGRIHEIFGQSGSGKSTLVSLTCANARRQYPDKYILYLDAEQACLGPDSYIYIPSKMRNEKISDLVNTTFDVMSYKKDGTFFTQNGKCIETGTKELFRIKTKYGYYIDATSDHKLLVNGEYKEVKDISIGDKLTIAYDISSSAVIPEISEKEADMARFLGIWIGDGTRLKPCVANIDPDIIEDIKNIASKYYGLKTSIIKERIDIVNTDTSDWYVFDRDILGSLYIDNNCRLARVANILDISSHTVKIHLLKFGIVDENLRIIEGSFNRKQKYSPQECISHRNGIETFLEKYDVYSKYSKELHIPNNISIGELRHILAGIFLTDGCSINPDCQNRLLAYYSTSSYRLAKDIQSALTLFGIFSRITTSIKKKNETEFYDANYKVEISGKRNISKFLESIPFYGIKRDKLVRALENSQKPVERIEYSGNIALAEVISIESIGDSKVYDIVTESNDDFESNFIANGLVVHNCNHVYMKKLGLDCENDEGVVFVQMQEAENVFEVIENAVATGAFSLVIVDSVPALITKRELEADYDKDTMAEKARFLSKSLPKLLELLKKSGTALIFVNQVRDKMDMWGGITTPGGKAIPFYSSSRVKINSTPSMKIKQPGGEGFIGQTVDFTIVKNKVGSPFGVGQSNLYFGVGFNKIEELIEEGVTKEIFEKGGAWFTLPYCTEDGEVIKVQGKNGLKAYFEQHPEELEKIESLIREKDNNNVYASNDEEIDEEGY
nr:MAG TPA: Protein recA [Caudoviricetes sp.]